jgi:quercetin dioxygenase-like cupin family protein
MRPSYVEQLMISKRPPKMDIQHETLRRWQEGTFHTRTETFTDVDLSTLVWAPYEDYMRAALIQGGDWETSTLIIEFPPEATEDNQLHVHPISDRVVTVRDGEGEFVAVREGEAVVIPLRPGDRIWMPRGVLHTFKARTRLVVESIHNPFVPLDHPEVLEYP